MRVYYYLVDTFLFVVDEDVLIVVPGCGQKVTVVVLDYFVNKLLSFKTQLTEMQGHCKCLRVAVNFYKVYTGIRAHQQQIWLGCSLYLKDMTK